MPFWGRVMSIAILISGIIGCFTTGYVGIFIAMFGLILLLLRHGVLIDMERNRCKKYLGFLWFKIGIWEQLDDYQFLSILKIPVKRVLYSVSNEHERPEIVYRVVLLNYNHRNKLEIVQCRSLEKAENLLNQVAEVLPFQKTIFSPF